MPETTTDIRKPGVGTQTVRLRDVDPDVLEREARRLMAQAKDEREWARLVELMCDPEDAGGRIAA